MTLMDLDPSIDLTLYKTSTRFQFPEISIDPRRIRDLYSLINDFCPPFGGIHHSQDEVYGFVYLCLRTGKGDFAESPDFIWKQISRD